MEYVYGKQYLNLEGKKRKRKYGKLNQVYERRIGKKEGKMQEERFFLRSYVSSQFDILVVYTYYSSGEYSQNNKFSITSFLVNPIA